MKTWLQLNITIHRSHICESTHWIYVQPPKSMLPAHLPAFADLHMQIGKHLEWRTITAETNRIRLWRLFQLSHCSSVSFLRTLQGHLSHICVTLRVCTSTALKWPRCKAETLSRIGKRKVVIGLTGKTQVLDKIHSGTSCCAVDCEVNVDDSTTLLKESGL